MSKSTDESLLTRSVGVTPTAGLELPKRLWVIPTLFLIIFGAASILRHLLLASWTYDLAIKSQVLYNCAAGRWLESSFEVQHYFGDHFNPTFLLLAPVYALFPSPLALVVVQCACVAAGGLIIGLLAGRWLPGHPGAALIAQAVFLLHPSTGNLVLYDVHENALAGTFILASVLMLEHRRWVWAGLLALLATGCKENGGLALAALGTWIILRHRRPGVGTLLIFAGLAYSFAALAYVLPHFRGELPDTAQRYAHLGGTPTEMVGNLLRRPHWFVATILQGPKILYLLVLLLPTLFVPLLRPTWLLPAGWVLLPNLLSGLPQQYSSLYQYDALVMPFIVLAMMQSWRVLVGRGRGHVFVRLVPRLTVAALLLASVNSRVWFWTGEAVVNLGRLDDFKRLCQSIPPEAPLSASMNLGPHLLRRQLLDHPHLDWPVERFADLPDRRAEYVLVDYAFELRHRAERRRPQHDRLRQRGFALIAEANDFALYQMSGNDS